MPLYTYVMSHKGRTAIHQQRKSNFKGFIVEAVSAGFPSLGNAALGDLMRCDPKPVENLTRAWECRLPIGGSEFVLHVVETRD